jgi:hypothetical protein
MKPRHPAALIEALHLIEPTSPEYSWGLSNHAPMALEALSRLDPARSLSFVGRYLERLRPLSEERDPALLGFATEVESLTREIDEHGFREVLRAHATQLSEHLAGSAFHGVLRVAHAARALDHEGVPVLRRELAAGLVYARARGLALHDGPLARVAGDLTLAQALARLEPVDDALVYVPGMITPTLAARAKAHPRRIDIASRVMLDRPVAEIARELRSAATRILARAEFHPNAVFTLLHGVTAMDAIVTLTRLLPETEAQTLVREGVLALLALRVAYVGRLERPDRRPRGESLEVLRVLAVKTLDEHAIKLAAALDPLDEPDASAALGAWLDQVDAF